VADTRVPQTGVGLSDEQVARLRCARIEDALVEVVAAQGFAALTVDDIAARGGLSRKTFYELYDNKGDAFFAAYDAIVERVATRMRAAAAVDATASDKIAAAVAQLLHVVVAHPTWARVCVIEAQTASALSGDHDRHLRPIASEVRRAHDALGMTAVIPPAEQAAIILGVLRVRLGTDGTDLGDLLPRFFELISGEEWDDRAPLTDHRPLDGDPLRAAAVRAALAAEDRAMVVDLMVEAVVDHDLTTLAVAEAATDDDPALRTLVRAGAWGGALGLLRHLGFATPGRPTTPHQARRVLELIASRPGVDGRSIRDLLNLSAGSQVSRLVRDLRGRGWIEDVSQGGRSRRWHATAAGLAALRDE
jgi:AcrR family transcriptional regulator